MLKRKKQQKGSETRIYIREAQVPMYHDPNVTPPDSDTELIPTPKDPPKRECTYKNSNGQNGKNGKNKENGQAHVNGGAKPLENGISSEKNGKAREWQEPILSLQEMPNCMLERCKFGCVCESLVNGTDRHLYDTHCGTSGLPECIFGCICDQVDQGERKRYRLGRWCQPAISRKEDDDCGFVPPGSQISLAHHEDGRPKRKSQPPERFRHGFDLNKVTLDKNFSAGNSFRNGKTSSNGYYYHGSGDKRNRNPLVTSNGIRSSGGINGKRDRNRNKSKSSTIKMLANGTIQKTRIIVRQNTLANRNRFPASSKIRTVSPIKNGPTKVTPKVIAKSADQRKESVGILKNPCENHDHEYNMESIITGLALRVKCDSNETSDGVLVNQSGTVVAVISWTTDGYMRPTVSRLRFKREHSKSRSQSPKKRPTNSTDTNDMAQPMPPTEVPNVEVHDSDLAILYLPGEEFKPVLQNGPCSSKALAQASAPTPITSHYRFFDLPPSYDEHSFVLYPDLHGVFSVNALRGKIANVRGGAKTQDETDSLGPKIIELNSINLNQQSDPSKRGNLYLLVDNKNLIVMGTIPEAYRDVQSKIQKQRALSPDITAMRSHVSC